MQNHLFEKIRVGGWRQFEQIEIDVHPRLTIITGANGAGKSTLLSLLTRHFGYHRNFLATPSGKQDGSGFLNGLFSLAKAFPWFVKAITPAHGTQIGEIVYEGGTSAILRLPPAHSIHYDIGVENQQNVVGHCQPKLSSAVMQAA